MRCKNLPGTMRRVRNRRLHKLGFGELGLGLFERGMRKSGATSLMWENLEDDFKKF